MRNNTKEFLEDNQRYYGALKNNAPKFICRTCINSYVTYYENDDPDCTEDNNIIRYLNEYYIIQCDNYKEDWIKVLKNKNRSYFIKEYVFDTETE